MLLNSWKILITDPRHHLLGILSGGGILKEHSLPSWKTIEQKYKKKHFAGVY